VELAPDAAIARRSRAERSKLRRELGRLDAVCLLIAAIVVLDTLGAVAKGGAQMLTLLAVVAVCFFVPAGLVIAELGAAFPNQSGPYVWTRLAFVRAGKQLPLAGAATQVGLLGFFTATVVAYATSHGVHGPAAGDLVPSWAVFAVVAPVLVYNFLGFELPSAAGEKLRDPARDVPASTARSWPQAAGPAPG
jgi:amino acid transporter